VTEVYYVCMIIFIVLVYNFRHAKLRIRLSSKQIELSLP